MKQYITIFALTISIVTNAQDYKRTAIWYFGQNAGLDFNTEPPTPLTGGQVNTIESCAAISDTNGNLVFYTDGRTVWSKNHQIMENGTGLFGDASSTQAALIVPYPDNDSLCYLFIAYGWTDHNSGFYYNLINIYGNNGQGEVIKKNVLLHVPVSEKLAAVRHKNGIDYWVSTTEYQGNRLYTYLITGNGIVECPVISSVPVTFSSSTVMGALKFSPSGKLAAMAKNSTTQVDVLSFDNLTGIFTFLFSLNHSTGVYGVEFSKFENYLYVMERAGSLIQYSLENLTQTSLIASKRIIYTVSTPIFDTQALQLGSNGKIYIAFNNMEYLGVINNPDAIHTQVDFDTSGQYLGGKKSSYGLSNSVSSYFYQPELDFRYKTNCEHDTIYFEAWSEVSVISPFWNIFKNTTLIHSANQSAFSYAFPDTGEYLVRLISNADTAVKSIYIEPKFSFTKDTTLCNNNFFEVNIPSNLRCINWQDGSGNNSYTVRESGAYYVSAYNIKGCKVSDTINVSFIQLATPTISRNGDSLFIDSGNYTYKWFYNSNAIPENTHLIKVTQNGNYRVEITDTNGCTSTSENYLVTGLSVKRLKAENYFIVYPVPASDKVFIQPKNNITIMGLILTDITGRKFEYTHTNELSLQGLSKGIYFLEITDEQNQIYTTKIIIH